MNSPVRTRQASDHVRVGVVHVVWEVTLACDLKCSFCGSRAGRRRPDELNTAEALKVVDDLAELGCRELTLIGGEAYLRKDLSELIRRAKEHGMYCAIQTGGRFFRQDKLENFAQAGLDGIGVSIDGMDPVHDELRGVRGSWEAAVNLLRRSRELGLRTSVNSQVSPTTLDDLHPLAEVLIAEGVKQWQLQLTVAMGNAVDNPQHLLQPFQIVDVYKQVLELYLYGLDHDLVVIPGNNIGYFGPQDRALRAVTGKAGHWKGCEAGDTIMGLEADGTIKGCPSLETDTFGLGKVREHGLLETWQEARPSTARKRGDDLSGFCKSCYYAPVCKAGCTWTSHSLLGYAGNNPYCYYRASILAEQGVKEVIHKVDDAPNRPFAIGRFRLSAEKISDGNPLSDTEYSDIQFDPQGPAPAQFSELVSCRCCGRFVYDTEEKCPHCAVANPTAQDSSPTEAVLALLQKSTVQKC